ncbi:MAG: PTS glucose transporter subunit IIA [Lachnospiraceae bacterium]|nr:PTS glucose transporter subunit IIA [Lachnospiraceae bacterium]
MDMFVLVAVGILSAMTGFWIGRSLQWNLAEDEEAYKTKKILKGNEIVSPVTGEVRVTEENGKREMHIMPEQGKIYAPAAGKIQKLYPMGSAMLLETEFGAKILLKVGEHVDDMYSDCYRCRVMEHEYVRKGALIMEYDPKGIAAGGANPEVMVSVQNAEAFEQMAVTELAHMKVGEPLIYVARGGRLQVEGELLENRGEMELFW